MKRRNSSNISKTVEEEEKEEEESGSTSGNINDGSSGNAGSDGNNLKDSKILDWSCEFLFKQGMEAAAMEIIFDSESCAGFKDSTLATHLEEYLKMKRTEFTKKSSIIDFVEKEWEIAVYILLHLGMKREKSRPSEEFSSSVKALFFIVVYNLYECTLPNQPDEGGSAYTNAEATEILGNIKKMFDSESVFLEDSKLYKAVFPAKNLRKGLVAIAKPHFSKDQECLMANFLVLFTYIDTLKRELSSIKEGPEQLFLEVVYRDMNNGLYAPSEMGMDDMKMFEGGMLTPRKSPRRRNSITDDEEKKRKERLEKEEKERMRREKEEEEERERKRLEEEERKRKEMEEMERERKRLEEEKEEKERMRREKEEEERREMERRRLEEEERQRKEMEEMERKRNETIPDSIVNGDEDEEDEIENDEDGEDNILKLIRMRKAPKYSLLDIKNAFPNPAKDGWDSITRQTDKDIMEFKNRVPRRQENYNDNSNDGYKDINSDDDDVISDVITDNRNDENIVQKSISVSKNQTQKSGAPTRRNDVKSPVGKSGVRRPFTQEEEGFLLEGVKTFGEGRWSLILESYPFVNRTNVNLKDKWRNMQKKASRERDQTILRIASEATKRKYPQTAISPPQKKAKSENVRRPIMKENDDDIYNDEE